MEKKYILLCALSILIAFTFGWIGHIIYSDNSYQRGIAGLYLENWNETEIEQRTKELSRGDWICVNIRGMKPKRALEVCRHEVGHEMFAKYCEKSPDSFEECMGLLKEEE